MREILFRGKRFDNGEWVHGNLVIRINGLSDKFYYIESQMEAPLLSNSRVDPETVGQYTGLEDMNGKKIFDGDVLLKATTGDKYYILWSAPCYVRADKHGFFFWDLTEDEYEIIGNVYDNPELM